MTDPDFPAVEIEEDESPLPQDHVIPLSERDFTFIKNFASTGFDPKKRISCAVSAGFQPGPAANMNSGRIIKALANNQKMQRAMKKYGIDISFMAAKLKSLLEAKSAQFPSQPDNFIQHRAWESAARVLDLNPPARFDVDKSVRHEIVIDQETMDRVQQAKQMLQRSNGEFVADDSKRDSST